MTDRDRVVVIGGGHNGLVCAAYLARAGREVTVLEAAAQVGGASATREFAKGFRVSGCAHLSYLLDAGISRELKLASHGLKWAHKGLKTVALAPAGDHLVLDGGRVASGVLSEGDRQGLAGYHARMLRFARVLARQHNRRPPRLGGGGRPDVLGAAMLGLDIRLLGREPMREFLRIAGINIYDVLEEIFESPLLKGALALDAVLGTNLGPRSNNSVLALLHRLSGQARGNGGPSIPEGGMGAVSEAIAAAARAAGATIRTGSPVVRISLDGARVSGVELESGEKIAAGTVVSNADPATTLLRLVGARHLETGFVHRVRHFRSKGMAAKLHLALDALPAFARLSAELAGERLVISPDPVYLEHAFDHAKYGQCSPDPALEITIPSVHDKTLAPAGQHVLSAIVQYAPFDPRASGDGPRRELLERTLGALERHAPGLRRQIVASELLLPADIEREFRITGGHWHHGELALDQFMMMRPVPGAAQYAMPVGGLFLCGAGCHPGGGVMGSAGRNAAHAVLATELAA
ncbi:MAG: NAD(P)/FAD-dependent oxidoreductase [Steroidobacteraceae bacterium]